MNLLLDTHAWVWWITGSMRLPETARRAIQTASDDGRLFLSAISVWEVAKLVSKERLQLDRDVADWVAVALEIPGLHLVPLTPGIACGSSTLPPPFHSVSYSPKTGQ